MKKDDIEPVLVIHGGAWEIPDAEVENHNRGIKSALEIGWQLLCQDRDALEVVEACIVDMEDNPTFDAGRGSVLNTDGTVEMDASIMDGKDLSAGAVAALQNFPNPISVARCILEASDHILLVGEGCAAFAREQGFSAVPVEKLLTPRERKRLDLLRKDGKFRTPHAFGAKGGTVGAVVLDKNGNVAAGTSTGGSPKKIPGRVGDTPLIGSGTYAENGVGGVSCTGWGESIIQVSLAKEVAEAIRSGSDPVSATQRGIGILKERVNGLGGVICLDTEGRVGMTFNTPRMARGMMNIHLDTPYVAIDPES